MTALQAAKRFQKARLTLGKNILAAMNNWAILTVRHVVQVRMERKGRDPVADPPNPPPGPLAIRSGALARTVTKTAARWDGTYFRVSIVAGGNGVDYARVHEFGGRAGRGHRSLIPARPYIAPSIVDRAPQLRPDIEAATRKTFQQAGI